MGYESWLPKGSRAKGRTSLVIMPALCPGLVLSHLIFTKMLREVKIIIALVFYISCSSVGLSNLPGNIWLHFYM